VNRRPLASVLLVLVVATFFARAANAAPDRIEVRGKVLNAFTGKPLKAGDVELTRRFHEDEKRIAAKVSSEGVYSLAFSSADFSCDPAELALRFHSEGFEDVVLPLFGAGVEAHTPAVVDAELRATTLNAILDIFSCCILNWTVLTVVLPAFFLAAAIKVFIPTHRFLKYLGPEAPRPVAYGAAVGSGMVLSLCSCNVVPLFMSIWRSGAGTGPAFAFLYAGPAISVVSAVFTYRVIGGGIAIWRIVAVAIMSVVVGLAMSRLFSGYERTAQATAKAMAMNPKTTPAIIIVTLLLGMIVVASLGFTLSRQLLMAAPVGLAIAAVAGFWLEREYCILWLRETGLLLWQTIPILIPAVLVMGYLATKIPMSVTKSLGDSNSLAVNMGASAFGGLMYFPVMTEVAFTKTLLKVVGIGTGPAMALLLTGPGLSLPGMILIGREIGLKKLACYVIMIIVMAAFVGMFFGSSWGKYLCSCKLD
jgi:uncharacterized protein